MQNTFLASCKIFQFNLNSL